MCWGSVLRKKNSIPPRWDGCGIVVFVALCAFGGIVAIGVVMKALFGDRWSWWTGFFEWWHLLLGLCIVVGVVVCGLYFWSKEEEEEDESGEV